MEHELTETRLALVLAGGGAKGAYQVGALEALIPRNVTVSLISGASIGALNGAVIAASGSLAGAHKKLIKLWKYFSDTSPIKPNYIKLIHTTLLSLKPESRLTRIAALIKEFMEPGQDITDNGILTNKALRDFLRTNCRPKDLARGIPLFVSLFPDDTSTGPLEILLTKMGLLSDTKNAKFLHVQKLSPENQTKALLATAAIPFAYSTQTIDGHKYSDGGQAAWKNSLGNVPITPAIERWYKNILVIHMDTKTLFSKDDYPGVRIVEIHPQKKIISNHKLPDIFQFSDSDFIRELMLEGYRDARDTLDYFK
jgi:NTE family protein